MKKELVIGIAIGLIANAIGLFFTAQLLGNGDDFTKVLKAAFEEGFLGIKPYCLFCFYKKTTRLPCKRCIINYGFYSCFYFYHQTILRH